MANHDATNSLFFQTKLPHDSMIYKTGSQVETISVKLQVNLFEMKQHRYTSKIQNSIMMTI